MNLLLTKESFELIGDRTQFTTMLSVKQLEDGKTIVHVAFTATETAIPPSFTLKWTHPILDIHGFWHPWADRNKGLQVDWGGGYNSRATTSAPVGCLYNINGRNRLTYALSDALNPIWFRAGVSEESAMFTCEVKLFAEPMEPLLKYEAELLIDTRDVPYYDSLHDVQQWWANFPYLSPSSVPEIARTPMYSTWYSFHQQITSEGIEAQCKEAKLLGCETVIVDDGWQTSDNTRGYAYCGDWHVCEDKIPDMKAHVKRVHQLGMKYLLWYSVPFIGKHSKAWHLFEDKMLSIDEHLGTGIVDPRFPEVREYLIQIYEQAIIDWNLDGLKLDFVDSFQLTEKGIHDLGRGRDYVSLPDAVDRLLTDVNLRLRVLKPDIMIEFRQTYVGPLMRKYGNMFRAADCPNDCLTNRIRTLDIRLLCGNTAAHSDMLMWNAGESAQSAALQLLNVLFSVPQISVTLDTLPEAHHRMVKFWLSLWKEHRDVLLDGYLEPFNPELNYPVVRSSTTEKRLLAAYHDTVIRPGLQVPAQLIVVNGTLDHYLVMDLAQNLKKYSLEVRNCLGEVVQTTIPLCWKEGLHKLDIPPAGVAIWTKVEAENNEECY
ncbi:MAG: alpha-galactosidase [Gorillibacterium sp.]|nr:alpha-galactosidase [Gorillibacterium sp.]